MKKLSKEDLFSIEHVLYNKARDIDVAIYNAMMDDTCKDFVLDSIMLYMTKDGGMGGGLYIDNYNPNSSVYQTYEALRILSSLDFKKEQRTELFDYIINKIGNYLFNRCSLTEGLWNPVVQSNNDYAHSEEFTYIDDFYPVWNIHPTAAILGYILECSNPAKVYYKKALKQIGYIFSHLEDDADWSQYQFTSYSALLGSLKKVDLFNEERKKIEERLKKEAYKHLSDQKFFLAPYLLDVELDDSLQARVDQELDEIVSSRKSHGLWEHPQGWGNTGYPEEDSASLKWLGAETVWNIYLLKKYGRIES